MLEPWMMDEVYAWRDHAKELKQLLDDQNVRLKRAAAERDELLKKLAETVKVR